MARTVVAKAADIKGASGRQASAGDETIALFKVGETVYAIDDTCPHRGCPLSDGDLDGTTLTCRCHGSQFDVRSGALLRGPAQRGVRSYPVTLAGDEVGVEI